MAATAKEHWLTYEQVIHSLSRFGRPIYGFDPDTYDGQNKSKM
jgi:histone H4